MGRLTSVDENGDVFFNFSDLKVNVNWLVRNRQDEKLKQIAGVLAYYEYLEEQGLLIRLPCKVGDTVYYTGKHNNVKKCVVKHIYISNNILAYVICCYMQFGDKPAIEFIVEANDFGKTVFLTRQEAEAALMKMEGEK